MEASESNTSKPPLRGLEERGGSPLFRTSVRGATTVLMEPRAGADRRLSNVPVGTLDAPFRQSAIDVSRHQKLQQLLGSFCVP